MARNKHNIARLRADADRVVHLLLHTPATVPQVAAEYGVSRDAVLAIYCDRTTYAQRIALRTAKGVAAKAMGCRARGYMRPIGTIATRRRGGATPQRWVKIKDDGPRKDRWVPYGRWRWEQANGPVPSGCRIVHFDRNRLNDDPDNLVCLTERQYAAWREADPKFCCRRSHGVAKSASLRAAARREARRIRFGKPEQPAPVKRTPAEIARESLRQFLGSLEQVA